MINIPVNISFQVSKSDKQKLLERNGCVFRGQELLDNHETDISKPCYCGRPNNERKKKVAVNN